MSKGAVNFSNDVEYYTPKNIVEKFGKFDYDPATTEEKAKDLEIPNYDTIETDGLKSDWTIYNRIWINPPFNLKDKFLERAVDTFLLNRNSIYILLPIEFLTTKKFYKITMCVGGKIFLPNGRIKFESGLNKETKAPAFGCIILKLQEDQCRWEIIKFNI
jgi:hypothetical protein